MGLFHKVPWPAVTAGLVTVIVSISGTVAIFFQMAVAAGASQEQIAGWTTALFCGSGLTTIALSLFYRIPVVTAWSLPAMVLLSTSADKVTVPQMVGVFVFCGLLVVVSGLTGLFERLMNRIPMAVASAMLAGIMLRFGMGVFDAMQQETMLVMLMFVVYLLARRLLPRYTILLVLAVGMTVVSMQDRLAWQEVQWRMAWPAFIAPEFHWPLLVSLGLPMFIATMASQNLPGIAVLKTFGYQPRVSALMTTTGIVSCVLAPIGCFSNVITSMIAAICMGKDVHEDPARRYWGAVWSGIFHIVAGLFGAAMVTLLAVLPKALIMAVAGFALFGVIATGITTAMSDARQREPALLTFLMTASGVTLFGIGSAFWGIVVGILSMMVLHWHRKKDVSLTKG